GAVARSRKSGTTMNVDMGGGTAKIAIIQNGTILETMAINVGARLVAWDQSGRIIRTEEAGRQVAKECGFEVSVGDVITEEQKVAMAEKLADILFEALMRTEY